MSTPQDSPRIGHGYDVHRLELPADGGLPLVIGGVRFEHVHGPVAHSDGDVLLHAVTDALLGALGEPDIGQLFSDTDPKHQGQDSAEFVGEAMRRVRAAGYRVGNLDATVVLECPKLGPRKEEIRARLAELLGTDAVNVKGKTHEGLDAVGRGKAIEAHAVVLIVADTRN